MKNLRIVLLAVTAVLSVFSFATMLEVRPGQQSSILEAARQRQEEPILSVTEPLETDTSVVAQEERIARMAADILADDEAFIERISAEVESSIPGYISQYVQSDEFKALFEASVQDSIDQIVNDVIDKLVTDENLDYVASLVAEKLGTSEEDVYIAAFSRIASRVLSMITMPDDETLDIEKAVLEVYQSNKDEIAYDVIDLTYLVVYADNGANLFGAGLNYIHSFRDFSILERLAYRIAYQMHAKGTRCIYGQG